jgi:hypothetical protein
MPLICYILISTQSAAGLLPPPPADNGPNQIQGGARPSGDAPNPSSATMLTNSQAPSDSTGMTVNGDAPTGNAGGATGPSAGEQTNPSPPTPPTGNNNSNIALTGGPAAVPAIHGDGNAAPTTPLPQPEPALPLFKFNRSSAAPWYVNHLLYLNRVLTVRRQESIRSGICQQVVSSAYQTGSPAGVQQPIPRR